MTFEVMRAHGYAAKRVEDWKHYRVEPKLDGVRVVCLAAKGGIKFYSRNGRELDMFSHLNTPVQKLCGFLDKKFAGYQGGIMFDGEMCSTTFNQIGGAIHRKAHTERTASYHMFHAMPLICFKNGQDTAAQISRREHVLRVWNARLLGNLAVVDSLEVNDDKHLKKLYRQFRNEEYEGLMLKNMSVPWIAKRTHDWMKIKEQQTEDLRIIGWKAGNGKYEGTLGALLLDRKGKTVSASGMTDSERAWLYKYRDKLESGTMVAEVEFQHATVHGKLRHIRFVRIRRDKEK